MEQVLWCDAGGIAGLLTLPAEQWQAIEADLLERGRTRAQLGTPELPWSAVVAMVRHCAPGSALFRVVHGERGRWSDVEHLLAWIVDLLNLLVWFKTKDGQKGSNRPKRVIRPGDDDAPTRLDDSDISESGAYRSSRNGPAVVGAAMTIEELDRFLKG